MSAIRTLAACPIALNANDVHLLFIVALDLSPAHRRAAAIETIPALRDDTFLSSLVRDVVNGVTVPGIASLKSTDKAQSPAISRMRLFSKTEMVLSLIRRANPQR
ncbi:hypothetical protein NKH37_23770 [Mesorhizobium sp. M1217]|uniref:hypothetical protein n=1 Tax=Mesorhizobium sp. M1217 TaxID=2957070 RepID=UPI0033350D05